MSNNKVGFVSLGCPKALVDSERILTQLKLDGYDIVPSYKDAEIVVVNTCGFIDSAKQESLDAIGEAISENGRVIVTGCMGKGDDADDIRAMHPKVLSVTGPAAYEEVVGAVHQYVPHTPEHDPFSRRSRIAGHFPGHQRLWRRYQIPHWILERSTNQDPHAGVVRDPGGVRHLGTPALCLPLSSR
jgi:tRNA A37 methylthiotransferase MiaB